MTPIQKAITIRPWLISRGRITYKMALDDADTLIDEMRQTEGLTSLPRLPRPDFFNFGVDVFVCNARAVELAGDAMEMAGELVWPSQRSVRPKRK